MIPEEMYQTLDETSLEHWVMELPEDEAGCESGNCADRADWRLILRPCQHGWISCTRHKNLTVGEFGTGPTRLGYCWLCELPFPTLEVVPL